jgi:hypothetical protein
VREHHLEALPERLVVVDDHQLRGHPSETYMAVNPNAAKSGPELQQAVRDGARRL